MKITYLGHACFLLESGGYRIVLDPFTDVPGYRELNIEAELCLCSHEHKDHAYRKGVKFSVKQLANPFKITEIESYHDDEKGAKRGKNIIRILEAEGIRVVHFGDLGCEPDDAAKKLLSGIDVALLPVGGVYTIDPAGAKVLIEKIKPVLTIPMHYRSASSGFDVIAPLEDFTKQFEDVETLGKSSLKLPTEKKGILVLEAELA
jgi:L-ascorbate metabolism protein UlaG (beta-lactamase superfamily)